jgi:diadenylate cyclase|tara:strand:+ start:1087 stop:2148 length:1062 start_codon:yes stop_codon:yes gene_type:complete
MSEKKEIQIKILKENKEKATKEDFLNILRQISPGTNMRAALEGVVSAKKGALIVVGNEFIDNLTDGGFKINCRFTPQRVIELAKMDGAILLSKDMKRITHANILLTPDTKIKTKETGTRHKAAERIAKQAGIMAMAVSERKNEINIYYKNLKYHLRSTSEVLRRATETLHILEKQRELFDDNLTQLNFSEVYDDLDLKQACKVIQKGKSIQKILKSQEKTLIELGNEGGALRLRIKELIRGVEKETDLIIKDYTKLNLKKTKNILGSLTYDELIDSENIITALAREESDKIEEIKGWRILSKTKIEERKIASLLKEFGNLSKILSLEKAQFNNLLGEHNSKIFYKAIEKLKNQ